MDEIARRYPSLSLDHVRELAAVVALERNAVATINQLYRGAPWGLACLACQAVKNKIENLDEGGAHPWLRYVREAGMAYTVVVDDVPLRVQPDIDDIRDVMPGERAAMLGMRTQLQLLSEPDPNAILRLEVAQRPGDPVATITLYLFNEGTGITLDSEVVYRRPEGSASAANETPPSFSPGAAVVPLARPAQDADPTTRFEFEDFENVTANDNERSGDD